MNISLYQWMVYATCFVTGIKVFDQWRVGLIAGLFPSEALDFQWFKGQIAAMHYWFIDFWSSEVILISWSALQKDFDRLIQFESDHKHFNTGPTSDYPSLYTAHLLFYIWVTCNLFIQYRMLLLWFLTLLQPHLVFLDGKKVDAKFLNQWWYILVLLLTPAADTTDLPFSLFEPFLSFLDLSPSVSQVGKSWTLWDLVFRINTWLRACVKRHSTAESCFTEC